MRGYRFDCLRVKCCARFLVCIFENIRNFLDRQDGRRMGVSSSSLVSISVASIGARRFSEVHGWWTEKERVDEEDGSFGDDIVRNRSLWDDGDDGRGLAAWSRPSAFLLFPALTTLSLICTMVRYLIWSGFAVNPIGSQAQNKHKA